MRLVTTKYQLICNTLFVMFWVLATYNFITQELAGKEVPMIELGVRLASQAILLVLGLWTLRSRTDMLVIAIFAVLSFVSTVIINKNGLLVWVDGVRLYVGFLFVVPIIRYLLNDEEFSCWFVERIDRNLHRFLWLQIPCIIWQMKYPHPDFCGGSLGWMMSGVISNLIYLSSFYLMLRRWNPAKKYIQNIADNWILIFLLFPTFLNETKISFVFMAMYFFFLIPMNRQFIKNLTFIVPIMVVVLGGALYLYTTITGSNDDITDMAEASTYLVGDEAALNLVEGIMDNKYTDEEPDFARGLKFAITPAIMNRKPVTWYVGYGIGQYKVGDSAKSVPFAKQYQWLLKGTMIEGHLIWLELGLIGLGLYLLYWPIILCMGRSVPSRNLQLQCFLFINALIFTVYNAPMQSIVFCIIFLYLCLVSTVWKSMPPIKSYSLLGKRPIRWSLRKPVEEQDEHTN